MGADSHSNNSGDLCPAWVGETQSLDNLEAGALGANWGQKMRP